jgi:hypothetical protein
LPTLELGAYGVTSAVNTSTTYSTQRQQHPRSSRERRTTLATYLRLDRRSSSLPLSADARPFKFHLISSTDAATLPTAPNHVDVSSIHEHWTPNKIKLGLSLYPKIAAVQLLHAEKITGMLLESFSTGQLQRLLHIDDDLRIKIDEAMTILTTHINRDSSTQETNNADERVLIDKQLNEYAPLFWQPDRKGVYAPRPGKSTAERLTAYRNVGR